MSMQKVPVMVPPLPAVPPGAIWAAQAAAWLFGGGGPRRTGLPAWWQAIRGGLAVDREARREAASRAALRRLAGRYESTQPEFAKDLFAAANNERRG